MHEANWDATRAGPATDPLSHFARTFAIDGRRRRTYDGAAMAQPLTLDDLARDAMDRQCNAVDQRFDRIEQKLGKTIERVDDHGARIQTLEKRRD